MADETPKDWVNHPHTRKLRAELKGLLEQAQIDLQAMGRRSLDSGVVAAAIRIDELQMFIARLQGDGETKEQT